MTDDMSFDEWYDLFIDKVKALEYKGAIDKYSFEDDYLNGVTPEKSAEDFVNEMSHD